MDNRRVTITDIASTTGVNTYGGSDSYNVSVTGTEYNALKGGVGGIVGLSATSGLLTIGDGSDTHKVTMGSNNIVTNGICHVGGLIGYAANVSVTDYCSNTVNVTGGKGSDVAHDRGGDQDQGQEQGQESCALVHGEFLPF